MVAVPQIPRLEAAGDPIYFYLHFKAVPLASSVDCV